MTSEDRKREREVNALSHGDDDCTATHTAICGTCAHTHVFELKPLQKKEDNWEN